MIAFICSPYAGDVKTNIENAKKYCLYAMDLGYTFFAPHLMYPNILDDTNDAQRSAGLKMGLDMLRKCDIVLVFGNMISPGMKQEIGFANKFGIHIDYIKDVKNILSKYT